MFLCMPYNATMPQSLKSSSVKNYIRIIAITPNMREVCFDRKKDFSSPQCYHYVFRDRIL